MTWSRSKWRLAWLLTVVSSTAIGTGCGDSGGFGPPSGSGGTAGAGGTMSDSEGGATGGTAGQGDGPAVPGAGADGFINNPVEVLLADPERSPFDFLQDARSASDYLEAASACYATVDACEAPECEAFASCCVATGGCCKPVVEAPLPSNLDFQPCAGMTAEACISAEGFDAEVFGPEAPVLTNRGLVPNGSPTAEGGVWIGDEVDLASERVRIGALLVPPIDCGDTCLQSAGVALTRASQSELMGAEVGLLLSGSRQTVSLILGGQVVDRFDTRSQAAIWSLLVSPSGTVEVIRGQVSEGRYAFDAAAVGEARLALFGRNLGADANSAAVAEVSAVVELCDNPGSWTERLPIEVTFDGSVEPTLARGREPSIASGPLGTAIAFEVDGEILIGGRESVSRVALSTPALVVMPTEPFEAGGIGEPELFWFQDSLYVFYTAYDGQGTGRIGSAIVVDDAAQNAASPVLEPSGDAVSLDSPTVAVRDDLLLMIVRATLSTGATELRAYYSVDPSIGWERIVDGTLEALTRIDEPTTDIDSPSLIVHNSAYQLYYARRSGTRWTVELASSDELLIWRPVGEALGPSGDGFDSLGARGPDARSLTDRIEIVYMGQDGVSFRLGHASRPAPSGTAPTLF